MHAHTALFWSWLNVLTKKRYDTLCKVYGGLDEALAAFGPELLKSLGCREETIQNTLLRLESFAVDQYAADIQRRGLELITLEDPAYPAALASVPDQPVFLSYKGDLSVLSQPCIGLVGTRQMSPYGKRVTEEFVPALVQAGLVTVSGLAAGIDTCIATETLAAGGRTVAVLGHGLAQVFPKRNEKLAQQILSAGGLILSEFPLDVPPDKYTFPARNRIIAGLTVGTVVLEAGEGSGALITADLALDYGREVFAVPGQIFDPNYEGCHSHISRGLAKLVQRPADVLTELGVVQPQQASESAYEPQNDIEKSILAVLTTMPQSVGDIVEKSGTGTGDANAALTMMELSGAAKNIGNGQWVRS